MKHWVACGGLLLMQGLLVCTPSAAAEDDWLGVPAAPLGSLQVWRGGAEDSESVGVDAMLTLGSVRLYGSLAETQTTDDGITLHDDLRNIGIGSDPVAALSARVDALSHGEEEAAEFMEYWLEVSGSTGPWDMSVHAMIGTAELFLRKDIPLPRVRRRSTEIDTEAFGANLGYFTGRLHLEVDYTRYWYSEDLGMIAERPFLELALGPVTVGHSATLPEEEGGCGASLAQGDWGFGLRYQQSRSALDGERLESAQLSIDRRLERNLGIGGRAILPTDGSPIYGELVLDVAF